MLHWLNPAYVPSSHLWCDGCVVHELYAVYNYPIHFPLQNMLVKALSAKAHNEAYARESFFAT